MLRNSSTEKKYAGNITSRTTLLVSSDLVMFLFLEHHQADRSMWVPKEQQAAPDERGPGDSTAQPRVVSACTGTGTAEKRGSLWGTLHLNSFFQASASPKTETTPAVTLLSDLS